MPRLTDRVALVTGASRGIGAAVAKRFAAEGAHVVLVARTVGGLEEVDDEIQAAGHQATLVPLDLREFDKIDEMGAALFQRFGRLDILVGNAAMLGDLMPVHHMDPELWDAVIGLNLTANWRLLRSMDPLLRASDAGRAIFVTSGAARTAPPYWGAYATAKAGLEVLVRTYAAENKKTHIRANILNPGAVRTGMRAQAFPGEDPESLPNPDTVIDKFVELTEKTFRRTGEVIDAR